jgi:hypothetical protein
MRLGDAGQPRESLVTERLNETQSMAAPVRLVHDNKAATILSDYFIEDELAAALGVTTRTLRRWHALGEGPPRTKIGCRIYYRRSSVERWLASRESAGRRGGRGRRAA